MSRKEVMRLQTLRTSSAATLDLVYSGSQYNGQTITPMNPAAVRTVTTINNNANVILRGAKGLTSVSLWNPSQIVLVNCSKLTIE